MTRAIIAIVSKVSCILLFLIMIYNSIIAVGIHIYVLVATHMKPSQKENCFHSGSIKVPCRVLYTVVYPLFLDYFYYISWYPSHVAIFQSDLFPLFHCVVFNHDFSSFVKNEKVCSTLIGSTFDRNTGSYDNGTVSV